MGEQLLLNMEFVSHKIGDLNMTIRKSPQFDTKIDNSKIINTLRKNAESCLNKASKVNTEISGAWTHRRQRFADSAQKKKDNFIKEATALNRLADLWETNVCPEILKEVRSASDFDTSYPTPPTSDHGQWYHDEYPKRLKKATKLGITSKEKSEDFEIAVKLLQEVVLSSEEIRARELKEVLTKVHAMNIPGFFPTPDHLIDRMIDIAQLDDSMYILEPSAGIGSILDRIKERGYQCKMDAVERQHSLNEILRLKGYNSSCEDILETTEVTGRLWDRIIMNPPFEKGQDVDHVLHCFNNFLKPGGRLVSIMSATIWSNSLKKYEGFREFLDKHGYLEEVEPGAFKNAFNSTGVAVVICVLNKSS